METLTIDRGAKGLDPNTLAQSSIATVGVGSSFVTATPPDGYEMLFLADANIGVSQGVAVRRGLDYSEDPSTFTPGGFYTPWVAFTVAIRPGPSP